MAVRGRIMTLRSGLDGIRSRGSVALVRRPNDFDETYLSRRELDDRSLPAWIREGQNARVALFADPKDVRDLPFPGRFTSTVKAVAAYGLADESWHFSGTDSTSAQLTFAKGSQFVGALLDLEEYSPFRWGTFASPAELRAWEIQRAPKELETAALREVRSLASYRARQEEFRNFSVQVIHAAAKADELRARDPKARDRLSWFHPPAIPETWELSSVKAIWHVTGPLAPSILVAYFDLGASLDVPGRDGAADGRKELLFDGSIVVVWSFSDKFESVLGEIVPSQGSSRGISNFTLHGGIGTATSLPALLFTAAGVTGALQPNHAQYAIDEEHALRSPLRPEP